MATNLALDQELLDRAFRVSGEPTKKAAVTRALLIQLCRKNDLTLLTTDQDFHAATKQVEFRLWSATWAASKTACIDPRIRRCLN